MPGRHAHSGGSLRTAKDAPDHPGKYAQVNELQGEFVDRQVVGNSVFEAAQLFKPSLQANSPDQAPTSPPG